MVQKATFKAHGMVPLGCISTAEGKLLKMKGARNAAIDGQANEIIVTYDSPKVTRAAIEDVFEECEFELIGGTEGRNEFT